MSYSIKGIVHPFVIAADADDRTKGKLVRIEPDGKATTELGDDNLLFFPLTEDLVVTESCNYAQSSVASAQITGVASVYVETAAGITAGVAVGPGTTGEGIAEATSGDYLLGIALATPAGDGVHIPVLLVPQVPGSGIY